MSDYDRIAQVIQYLETHFREQPDLKELSAQVGLSEFHLQRLFRRWAGISPKRFLQVLTAEYARERLQESANVLAAAYDSGLSGPGRLHDLTVNVFAMTPGALKSRGGGLTIRYSYHESPFGECLIAITERGVCGLRFVSPENREAATDALKAEWAGAQFLKDSSATGEVINSIFSANRKQPLSLYLKGTNFQIRVWEALLHIPEGAVTTYGQIAAQIGSPKASRAVGSAVGKNPIGYLIPCHRVIRKSGIIGEYRWGSLRKKAILGWEAARLKADAGELTFSNAS